MANYCISHNHSDHWAICSRIIGETLGVTSSTMNAALFEYVDAENTPPHPSPRPVKNLHLELSDITKSDWDAKTSSEQTTWVSGCTKTNWPHGMFRIVDGPSNCVHGDIHFQGAVDDSVTLDTTLYDEVIAAGAKVIHLTWSDWTHDSFDEVFKNRCDHYDTDNNVSDWTERMNHYKDAMSAITYPSNANNFVLYEDKILQKDAAHYTALCTFLGQSELTTSTWNGWVDDYWNHVSA